MSAIAGRSFASGPYQSTFLITHGLEPRADLKIMRQLRGVEDIKLLCAGPGRLGQALGITMAHNGWPIDKRPFLLRPSEKEYRVRADRRVERAACCCQEKVLAN